MRAAIGKLRVYDGLAISASFVCLVHCLVVPALVLLAPALAAYVAFPEAFHLGALAFAVPTSVLALAAGYRRHRWSMPLWLVVPGLCVLTLGALVAPEGLIETLITVLGASALAIGHALNWRALPRTSHSRNRI